MNRSLHYDTLDISREWFEIGNSKKAEDPTAPSEVAFRFIAYWIAFNGFYGRGSGNLSEREQIEKFLDSVYSRLMDKFDFNTDKDLEVFLKQPVFSGSRLPNEDIDYKLTNPFSYGSPKRCVELFQCLTNNNESEPNRIVALLLTIYQVRCNMFHGSKTPYPQRNYELVYASQKVLEQLLKTIIGMQ